jgi:hypothetical protein
LPGSAPAPDYVYFALRHPSGFNISVTATVCHSEWEENSTWSTQRGYEVLYTADRIEDLDPQVLRSPFVLPSSSLGTVGRLIRASRTHPWYAIPGRLWRKGCNVLRPIFPPRPLWEPQPARLAG